jgi:hypothetical protein
MRTIQFQRTTQGAMTKYTREDPRVCGRSRTAAGLIISRLTSHRSRRADRRCAVTRTIRLRARRCLLRGCKVSVQPSTSMLFAILPIHLFEKSGTFELVDKALLDESLRVGVGKFRTGPGQQIEHRFTTRICGAGLVVSFSL